MDKASTVDLMRLLLSYVVDFASSKGSIHHNQEIMESSVRSLLSEIAKMSLRTPESNVHGTMQNQFSDRNGQALGSFQKNIEMKRGDWICARYEFIGFSVAFDINLPWFVGCHSSMERYKNNLQ